MQFIPESIIDEKAAAIGADENFSDAIQSLKNIQPALLAYLFSSSFDLLTQSEKEYTMFLALVIWSAVDELHPDQEEVSPEMIEKAEDANWEIFKDSKAKEFRDQLSVFFENTPQEDLLAFVEDALIQDEDDMISKEGRAYVFMALKTIIDCLDNVA